MGYIYLICDSVNNTYKIGITKNEITKRLKELKTGNSSDIFILNHYESEYYKSIEKLFHRKYQHYRHSGEWFVLPDDIVLNFIKICEEIESNHIFLLKNNTFYGK